MASVPRSKCEVEILNELINRRLQALEEKISFQEDAVQKLEAELIYHQKKSNLARKDGRGLQLSLRKIENNVGTEKQKSFPRIFRRSKKMKAIVVNHDYSLTSEEVATPVPDPKEILIKVQCAGVNRADLMQRRGFYPPPPGASKILGLECAGTVESIGSSCKRYQVGDAVCALLPGGGYAEYVAVDEGSALPIPAGFSFEQAASLPEVFATAWLNLFDEGALEKNSTVLIHAGASGVGTAAIQLCRAYDSRACVTVGSQLKLKKMLGVRRC